MIIITGAARSGTSLTTGVLRACGLNLGHTRVNGLNEALEVRENLIKPYLRSIGCDPLGQDRLPEISDLIEAPEWRNRVWQALGEPAEPWGYKDAKVCLMWPVWHEAFPQAKWVIVRRNKYRIVDSCLRTHFMRRRHDVEGWGEWVDHHEARFAEIRRHCDAVEVWPEADPSAFRDLVESVGLDWNEQAVANVIDPGWWHG